MMPMFLPVYLSNNDQHFTEVPIMPETMCRDVMELCKEPGEAECYLAEMWRGTERVVEEEERMLEVLQRWGQQRVEVRFILRHLRAPGRESGGCRAADQMMKRKQVKSRDLSTERSLENGGSAPCLESDATLSELQGLASLQQQQISTQQHLLASKEQQLHYLQLQDQRPQQRQELPEQERLRQLRENAHNQEAKLRRVRALRGQVEQKRLSNNKLVEEIEQMSSLFHQKQRELLMAAARVEELSDQLQALRSSRLQPPLPPHQHTSSTAELEHLCGEMLRDQKSLSDLDLPPPLPSRSSHTTENLLRDNQVSASGKSLSKMMLPPPVPSKPKSTLSKPLYNTGTFPGKKVRPVGGHLKAPGVLSIHSNTLPLPNKQESPPAATVRPYTPDLSDGPAPVLQKPQSLAASSIYSMYTQQATPGKGYQPGQGTLPRSKPPVYGKPVATSGGQQTVSSDNTAINSGFCGSDTNEAENNLQSTGESDTIERATPRPLSPTKLLPFLSNPHKNPNDADLEAVRRRLHAVPRPLKKRNSITEPEGPSGPNILKLLYQKTTLAAMETIPMETVSAAGTYVSEDRIA
ncbi:apoptosis-stimulating of p53 protein 2 [Nematolebias whitei]|uniref:apoptosis-stimulating of p53 protein 2 n=1 Tax=Nematolebias whitei TaxID=451745 RepID=UPI00189864FC|nr:apoptosis-stimulating of p53 protein 2 [Nematolebias whitei]